MNQIEIHKKIDGIVLREPITISEEEKVNFVYKNPDATRYFFTKADSRWFIWLWKNNYLDAIKKKAEDPTKCSNIMPELGYLMRVAEQVPEQVAEVIKNLKISKDNFNSEVLSDFLRICSDLPAQEIAKLTKKIKSEGWVKLMSGFNEWGFEYKEMFEKLVEAKEYTAFLDLAEAVLSIKNNEERGTNNYSIDNPFYLKNLEHTEIFENLLLVDNKNLERTFALLLSSFEKIFVSDKKSDTKVFDYKENYYLLDADFFTLKFNQNKHHYSYRDSVQDLVAVLLEITEKIIGDESTDIKKIYNDYIEKLSNTQTLYRFRLFFWCLKPDIFKNELEDAFFSIFKHANKYYELIHPEYYWALKKCFYILDEEKKINYIKNIFEYFAKERPDKNEEKIYKKEGWRILSCISDYVPNKDKAKIEFGFELNENFEPQPAIGPITSGWINPKSPIELPELGKMEIKDIVKKLCSDWSPESLYKQGGEQDFMNPRNAEGMSRKLEEDILLRPATYLENAGLFFNKSVLDEHYTHSFLHAFYNLLNKEDYNLNLNLEKLLDLFYDIQEFGKTTKFSDESTRREIGSSWLVNWTGVHNEMADILKKLLQTHHDQEIINFDKNRERILEIIEYLLNNANPDISGENIENGADPFSHAINSVRGRAFEDLALFVYLDGKKYPKDTPIKIDEKVKQIYEAILDKEKTQSLFFVYGRFLPVFYYRDKIWSQNLFSKIFPTEPEKINLFFASAEGYLSTDIYEELFEELSDIIYTRLIETNPENYTKRRYFKELDEGLATHLALAFVHYNSFNTDSKLFELFWKTPNTKKHEEFISFIGRYLISRDDSDSFMNDHDIDRSTITKKLKNLWEWILKNGLDEKSVYAHFSYWVGEKEIIFTDLKWLADKLEQTLEKSGGNMEWADGMTKKLPSLATIAPVNTLKLLNYYLVYQAEIGAGYFGYSLYSENIIEALKILYSTQETKDGVVSLINELLEKGSTRFYDLKKVLE